MRNIILSIATIGALSIIGCGSSGSSNKEVLANNVKKSQCFSSLLQESGADCKYITLKANYDEPKENRNVKIFYSILKSKAQNPLEPVIYLIGGPGSGANPMAGEHIGDTYLHYILDKHDLILVDYRGTGFSEPYADCHLALDGNESELRNSLQECVAQMDRLGIKATDYTSKNIARDIKEMLDAEHIDKAILYGTSYGTRVALTIARDYPQKVSGMVLDGAFPIEANGISQASESVLEKLADIRDRVEKKYPNFDFNKAINDLSKKDKSYLKSLVSEMTHMIYEGEELAEKNAMLAYAENSDALYKIFLTELLPKLAYNDELVDIAYGLFTTEQNIMTRDLKSKSNRTIDPKFEKRGDMGLAMAYSVILAEEFAFIKDKDQQPDSFGFKGEVINALKDFEGGAPVPIKTLSIINKYFKVKPNPIEKQAVKTDIPTLIFSGGKDMQTARVWSERLQKDLKYSLLVFAPEEGHVYSYDNQTASQLRDEYMADMKKIIQKNKEGHKKATITNEEG